MNPFSERDIDDARQNFLAQDALVKGSVAEQAQIQSQLDRRFWLTASNRRL